MYNKTIHIHFVGIGGIGMSGIATILAQQGYCISGCDADTSQQTVIDLKRAGCTIFDGNNTHGCQDDSIDVLVYSSALKADNPEIVAAQQRGIPTIGRALMLAELMRTKFSIAIAGSHGKTTTTSLIAHILIEAGQDPTIVIGGRLKNISSNARMGNGNFLVAEADESDRSLVQLHATLAVITNIDYEHAETYNDLQDVKETFLRFLNNLPFYGKAYVCADDKHLQSLLPLPHVKTIKYGIEDKHADIRANAIDLQVDHSSFEVIHKQELLGRLELAMPGMHNIYNALAATSIALELGVPFKSISTALQQFKGVEHRFSFNGTFEGAYLFDDYGHHPREIQCTLAVARKRAQRKLLVAFQPHRYTRTRALWQEFVEMFLRSPIDGLVITDIYSANEQPISGVTGELLARAIEQARPPFPVFYVPLQDDGQYVGQKLREIAQADDLVLLQGAGKINRVARHLNLSR